MATRNQQSVPGGRTNHVRPLPRLNRSNSMKNENIAVIQATIHQSLSSAVAKQTIEKRSYTSPPVVEPKIEQIPTLITTPAVATVYKPLIRDLPLDHFVDGISARPRAATVKLPKQTMNRERESTVRSLAPVPPRDAQKSFIQKQTVIQPNPKLNKRQSSAKGLIARFVQVGSYGIASVVMLFFGWLAYDTWQTNTDIKEITGNSSSSQAQALAARYDETQPTGNPLKNYAVAPDLPRAVYIEKLGVEAKVIRVGVTDTNAMAVPKSIYEAGWYDGSVKPGETGAVVINGHVSGPTKDGVFHDLKQLKDGDMIVIERGDGSKLSYRVNRTQEVAVKDVNMTELLVADPGKKSLHLITCGGLFDKEALQFQSRVLVYADQI